MAERTTLFAETPFQRLMMERAKALAQEIERAGALEDLLQRPAGEVEEQFRSVTSQARPTGGLSEERWLQLAVGAAVVVVIGLIAMAFMALSI